jgi:hypothetical protein
MVIATWDMLILGGYRQVESEEKGALKSMVTLRPQPARQEYGRFVQVGGSWFKSEVLQNQLLRVE